MKIYRSERSRWIVGLMLILIVYSLFYLFFVESDQTQFIPRRIRHIIKFSTTILVYLIGTFHLGKLNDKWMYQIWHFIHISLLAVLVLIGAYDWLFGMVSKQVKDFTVTIQEFLISPVLYVGMGIIQRRLKSS